MVGPFLIGARVQLRPFEEEDAPTLANWINDPEIRRFLMVRFARSVKDEKEWIASLSPKENPRNLGFAIELRQDRRLIGSIGMHMIDWIHRRAMTGFFLYPESMRGKGYGTEAMNLLLDYGFGELGMQSLWAMVFEGNEASCRSLLKQGYTRSGLFRKAYLVTGQWTDTVYFDILREEWEALRSQASGKRTPRRKR